MTPRKRLFDEDKVLKCLNGWDIGLYSEKKIFNVIDAAISRNVHEALDEAMDAVAETPDGLEFAALKRVASKIKSRYPAPRKEKT